MVYEIVHEYPNLGSFLYGHWEDFGMHAEGFLIVVFSVLALLLITCICGLVGYILQTVALCKISKRMGAWRGIRTMAVFPFVRYFAIGKLAERADALQESPKRRLWGRILLILGCIAIPFAIVALIIAAIGLPGAQLFVMITESANDIMRGGGTLIGILYIACVLLALPVLVLGWIEPSLFALIMVILPFAGLAGLIFGVLLVALIRTIDGVCYYKVLKTVYAQKTALILTVVGAVTGLSPIVLFAASLKKK